MLNNEEPKFIDRLFDDCYEGLKIAVKILTIKHPLHL